MVRTGRIELPSLEWRSNIEPINYVRMLAAPKLADARPAIALRDPARQPSLASRAKAGGQGMDLNLRTPKGRRLQRRCFGRLHTCPRGLAETGWPSRRARSSCSPRVRRLVAGRGVAPRSTRLMRPLGSLADQPAEIAEGEKRR